MITVLKELKKAVNETFGYDVEFIGDMWFVKLNS
jgi:hypothetical protein